MTKKILKPKRFLLCVDGEDKDVYILHREFPRCLIYVEQKTPLNFVVFDFFEDDQNEKKAIEILTSDKFKKDLKNFFITRL